MILKIRNLIEKNESKKVKRSENFNDEQSGRIENQEYVVKRRKIQNLDSLFEKNKNKILDSIENVILLNFASLALDKKYLSIQNFFDTRLEVNINNYNHNFFKCALGISKPVLLSKPTIKSNSYDFNRILQKEDNFITSYDVKIPKLGTFIIDSGKLTVIDKLLIKLKLGGHRVLIYFQMTKMMDLMEDYCIKKGYTYCRLDGSCRLNARRDTVNNWQNSDEKFIFLLSTRAGGLGINLTAADTVIFYDSDWNPTMDQQAMDRAHRLGQTKDVTVYRLITKDTIEERVMEKAMRKGEIQKMVIQGGDFNF
ncbi:putative DNA helicase ino80 [Gurleya vavrai]